MRKSLLDAVDARLKKDGGAKFVIRDMRFNDPPVPWDDIVRCIEMVTKVRVTSKTIMNWMKAWDEEDAVASNV